MKAIIFKEYGDSSRLVLTEMEKPEPGEGEVLVRIKAAGVNPVDFKIRNGAFQNRRIVVFPVIPGWDMAGEVEANGHSARRFSPGDKVYAYARRPVVQYGTYAEYTVLPESYITRMPAGISFEEAAAIPLAVLTAYQSVLVAGELKKGQDLLVLGASGGVGSFAVQLGKISGARVFTVAGKGRETYLKSTGADEIIDYTQDDFVVHLQHLLPEGADVVFDCVGGDSGKKAYQCVKKGGRLVSITSGEDAELAEKYNVRFTYVFVEPNVRQLDQISEWLEDGKLKVHLDEVFDLKDAAKAHQKMETMHTQGKIVLRMP